MGIRDKVTQAANLTKWRVDQQRRLFSKQGEIADLENQVRGLKARLADAALALYLKDLLTEADLKANCSQIAASLEAMAAKKAELDEIRKEKPPEAAYTASLPIGEAKEAIPSALICPQCGKELVGLFCPDHGREGVAKPPPDTPFVRGPQVPDQDASLVCPQCGRLLKGQFCPEHGVEGVPGEGTPQEREG